MFQNSGIHVIEEAPKLPELVFTLAPGRLLWILVGTAFVAAAVRRLTVSRGFEGWRVVICALLGLVPIMTLYGLSVETPLHVFVDRYRVVAIPGIALCWGMVVSIVNSRALRLLFCVVLVAVTTYECANSPFAKVHGYTWKYALQLAEKNASVDEAPVLICSDFVESNYMPMPSGPAVKDSAQFAPLTYYKLSVPVVALPRALNYAAIQIGSTFLKSAAHRRFLVLGFQPSYQTLHWFADNASGTHDVRELGESFGIVVLEFTPRS